MKNLRKISQSGVKRIIEERLENPTEYIGRPVVIWRSVYHDGMQAFLVEDTCKEYNAGRPDDEWKLYKHLKVGAGKVPEPSVANLHQKVCVVEVALPSENDALCRFEQFPYRVNDEWLREIEHEVGMPIIVFMSFNEHPEVFTESEEYLFTPSLREWLEFWRCSQNNIMKLSKLI